MQLQALFKKIYIAYPLLILLLIAVILRFLFFPTNTQFAYDQARDAITSQQILKGKLKIIGPPSTANPNLNHGALFYYIAGPIYYLSYGNPEGISVFLRIYNAFGVLIIFTIASILANKRIGLIAAFLYTISFEQTQYALFLGHPAMAVLTTMLFYLGFSVLIFQKKSWGLVLAAIGFGLSMQFHIGLLFLAPSFFIYPFLFRKQLPKISPKILIASMLGLALTIATFILAEIKYHFRMSYGLLSIFSQETARATNRISAFQNLNFIINRYINDNLISFPFHGVGTLILGIAFYWTIKRKSSRNSGIFLLMWFLWGLIPYFLSNSQIYYYSIGTSASLLILGAFIIDHILRSNKLLGIVLLIIVLFSNLRLISHYNPQGSINSITSQDGMLLTDQKDIIDYTYKKADGQQFAVNALTIPYNINTTWSYLYDWYGRKKYGYTPIWGGNHANGYPTRLLVNNSRSTLPKIRFLIVEPTQGLQEVVINDFLREEGYFTTIVSTAFAGKLKVYEQKPR